MRIAVAGGTGTVGKPVVEVLRERGHEAVVLARSTGVDLRTGAGLDLTGVDAVIDLTSLVTRSAPAATEFFEQVTANLHRAEQAAGVRHHVLLGIVGSDAVPFGYYTGKMAQERAVERGPVPWTLLRATQFHEFAGQPQGGVRVGPLTLVPAMRVNPIAAREVAERLVDLAVGAPAGRVRDLGGPEELPLDDMIRRYAAATGRGDRVLRFPLPGKAGRAFRQGALVAGPDADRGIQTFAQWLEMRP
ncbi:SDR family oxidoreductase [Nocardia sp. NPDC057227]|uniref:SDR family oxidoreductase n=1 Tax=Nocardia sp. NPDC057227 TaxID=3346056 RepID=UPI0036272737